MIIDKFKKTYQLYSDKQFTKKLYHERTGKKLNLKKPIAFNEKIQWLKLYDRSPLKAICADKFLVNDHVKKLIGEEYLVPRIFHTKNVEDINPYKINPPCIIKTNHDSGRVYILREGEKVDWKQLRTDLQKKLNINYYKKKREWQYKNVEPRILVEKLLLDKKQQIPNDYKFFCFHGEPQIIQVDHSRFENHKRTLYDKDWNFIDVRYFFPQGEKIQKPFCLDKMLDLCRILSRNFIFVRVDLYNIENAIYFGELTFHPGNGMEEFSNEDLNLRMGAMIHLNGG